MSILSLVTAGRRLVNATLVDRVVVQELQAVPDDQGGVTQSWVDVSGQLAARFGVLSEADQRGRSLREAAGQVEGAAGTVLQVPLEAISVTEGRRVRDVATGRLWQVLGELTPPSQAAIVRRLLVREV